jgi:hypothetical protein
MTLFFLTNVAYTAQQNNNKKQTIKKNNMFVRCYICLRAKGKHFCHLF